MPDNDDISGHPRITGRIGMINRHCVEEPLHQGAGSIGSWDEYRYSKDR